MVSLRPFIYFTVVLLIISSCISASLVPIGNGYRLVSVAKTTDGALIGQLKVNGKNDIYGPDIPLLQLYVKSDTPVSLVSPTYYAHLVAARGREYLESYIEDNDLERALTVRQVRKLISLKPNIARTMFYA